MIVHSYTVPRPLFLSPSSLPLSRSKPFSHLFIPSPTKIYGGTRKKHHTQEPVIVEHGRDKAEEASAEIPIKAGVEVSAVLLSTHRHDSDSRPKSTLLPRLSLCLPINQCLSNARLICIRECVSLVCPMGEDRPYGTGHYLVGLYISLRNFPLLSYSLAGEFVALRKGYSKNNATWNQKEKKGRNT